MMSGRKPTTAVSSMVRATLFRDIYDAFTEKNAHLTSHHQDQLHFCFFLFAFQSSMFSILWDLFFLRSAVFLSAAITLRFWLVRP
jgi:hypothetical protein